MTATRQQRHAVPPESVTVRLAPELVAWLREYAHAERITQTAVITQALEALKGSTQ